MNNNLKSTPPDTDLEKVNLQNVTEIARAKLASMGIVRHAKRKIDIGNDE